MGLWLAIAAATSAKMGTPMWEGIAPSSVSLPDQEVGLLLKQGGDALASSLTSSPLYTAFFVAASPAGERGTLAAWVFWCVSANVSACVAVIA